MLAEDLRLPKGQENLHVTGKDKRKKKNKERKESGWDLHRWEGPVKKERFLHTGRSPHWRGDQLGWEGDFRASEESTATGLWRVEWRETCTDGDGRAAARHSPA